MNDATSELMNTTFSQLKQIIAGLYAMNDELAAKVNDLNTRLNDTERGQGGGDDNALFERLRVWMEQDDAFKEAVRTIANDEIDGYDFDDKVGDWMSNRFDINDYSDNLDLDDAISSALDSNSRLIRDAVRDLTFEVTVS